MTRVTPSTSENRTENNPPNSEDRVDQPNALNVSVCESDCVTGTSAYTMSLVGTEDQTTIIGVGEDESKNPGAVPTKEIDEFDTDCTSEMPQITESPPEMPDYGIISNYETSTTKSPPRTTDATQKSPVRKKCITTGICDTTTTTTTITPNTTTKITVIPTFTMYTKCPTEESEVITEVTKPPMECTEKCKNCNVVIKRHEEQEDSMYDLLQRCCTGEKITTTTVTPTPCIPMDWSDPLCYPNELRKKLTLGQRKKLWIECQKMRPLIPVHEREHIAKYGKPSFKIGGCKFTGSGSCYTC